MEKRMLIASTKRYKRYFSLEGEDRISRLSDDLLFHILSYLTLKEATRTSILSTRWKDLWIHTSRLDFDAAEDLEKLRNNYSIQQREVETCKYVEWVNQVLKLHKSTKLTDFKVRFDIRKKHEGSMHEWIKYAYAKDVDKLDMSLLDDHHSFRSPQSCCTFPNLLSLTSPSSDYCGLKNGFKSLRELCFKFVNVSGEELGYFLRDCPLLEQLIVHNSGDLVTLEVSGPALKLKHLEIVFCPNLKFIKVSDTNLISLVFKSERRLELHNVPMLVDLSFCGRSKKYVRTVFSWLFCCLSQLEVLRLTISIEAIEKMDGHNFPVLSQLKELIIIADARENRSLIGITSLTRACPFLQRFVVKLRWFSPNRRRRVFKEATGSPLQRLTEFQLSGYYGRISEVELITFVLQNAAALEKITVDPREHFEPYECPTPNNVMEKAARHFAEKQLRVIPEDVELVIL